MMSDFQQWLTELSLLADQEFIVVEAKYYDGLEFLFKNNITPDQALPRYKDLVTRIISINAGKEVNPFKLNDLQVLHIMADLKQDIKSSTHFVEARKHKAGGLITIGVDDATFINLSSGVLFNDVSHYVILYVVNKDQYHAIKDKHVGK